MKHLFFFILCGSLLAACSSRQDPVDELRDLCEEVENVDETYDEKDIESLVERHSEIMQEISENDYSESETQTIAELERRYSMSLLGKTLFGESGEDMRSLGRSLGRAAKNLEENLREFEEGFEEGSGQKLK